MEITCNRCHNAVQPDDRYCPACGLPQLVYSAENGNGQETGERYNEPVRDAGTVAWKPAIRVIVMLAVPAGLLCSVYSPLNMFGLFWMAAAAAWAVLLYVRNQQAPWITLGAGARIGLVTGILGGWTAAASTGATLVAMRFFLHQSKSIDDYWGWMNNELTRQLASGADPRSVAMVKGWVSSSEGRAGILLIGVLGLMAMLLFFSIAGGALGARLTVRARRPEA